ncbi:MAG: zinc ABC transporter substrate-binding protein [Bacteroidales bacterium]|nr:zinc ABC transporter substrate-binding protein [Bacteroidales bacterium]
MNRFFIFLGALFCLLFASCSGNSGKDFLIMVTIEPQRYFAEQLADTFYSIQTMVPPGTSPESYDPSPQQMTQLAKSMAYFQIGYLGFENVWIEKLKNNNPELRFFNNGEGIDYIHSTAHSHEHEDGHHHDCSGVGVDPHTWSSPKQARIIATNMYNAFLNIDVENTRTYYINYIKLLEEIDETDRIVQEYLNKSNQKAFIIYHPALSYLARDYGLTQYAIEMDGKEPSAEQIKELIDTAKEKNIKTVFIQQEFDKKNAETIAKETGCKLVTINPLSYHWKEEIIRIAKALSDE